MNELINERIQGTHYMPLFRKGKRYPITQRYSCREARCQCVLHLWATSKSYRYILYKHTKELAVL